MASSPNPIGSGFLTNIGIVWKTINIENPTSIIIRFAGSIDLLSRSLKSTKGYFSRLSIITKNTNETIPMIRNGKTCA
jgi:hypothetical protein